MKKPGFSQKILFFFFTREKTYFFSHLVSWHLMIRSLRRFKPLYWYQPWIYPSQYPSCWLCFHPAGFGWQFSQERARCSWKMSDNIKCDHSQSGVVRWFFPKNHPRSINWNMAGFFHWKKWFWIAKVRQTVEQKYRTKLTKSWKIMKNQSEISVFNHFGWKF